MNRKTWFFLILSSLGVVIIFAVALMVGKYYIAPKNFFRAVFTKDNTFLIERTVIVKLRLPRTLRLCYVVFHCQCPDCCIKRFFKTNSHLQIY